MIGGLPRVRKEAMITIEFSESAVVRVLDVDAIADKASFGDVVGLEVLDWGRQLGCDVLTQQLNTGTVSWSYDGEIDALYLRLQPRGVASDAQRKTTANVGMDKDGHVARLSFLVPD